jgi:hypothetical protein
MFDDSFNVCAAIAENIVGGRHIWVPKSNLSYISLDGGQIVFMSNGEKFQSLGTPSVHWESADFIDIQRTAERLSIAILRQISVFEVGGKAISEDEQNVFKSHIGELDKDYWVNDIDSLEIEWWINFLQTQKNPIFQDLAMFLCCYLNIENESKRIQSNPHYRELLRSEIDSANKLADFLTNHSNRVLREGADWIPEWIEAH